MTPYYSHDGILIYHANCLDILPTFCDIDHVITDPPYSRNVYERMRNINSGSGRLKTKRVNIGSGLRKMAAGEIGDVNDIALPVAVQFARIVKRWCVVFSDVEFCGEWRRVLEGEGLRYVRTGAWVKPDAMPQMSGDRPGVGFEPCTIAHAQGRMRWNGGGDLAVWTYGTVKLNRPDHPCPKPEALMRHLILQFTDEDEFVLDPFMGSGTTLVAAKRLGRKAIGIELEEKYCEIAAKRLQQGALPMELQRDV